MTRGTHILAEYSGCDPAILDDAFAIEALLVNAAAAAGATIVARRSHRFDRSGLTSMVALEESHMSLHSWPAAEHASVDFFTCGQRDVGQALAVLLEGLRSKSSEIVEIQRGLPGAPKIRVLGHRAVERITIDCRSPQLPPTVRAGRSPGRGLGLFATRAFDPGESLYEAPVWLASCDTEYILQTDVGESIILADDLGCYLTVDGVSTFPESMLAKIAAHYGLEGHSPIVLRDSMTDGGERGVMVTGFDGLINHSERANVEADWTGLTFEDDELIWMMRLDATRRIAAGDELFWDYTDFGGNVPPDWLS